MAAQVEFEIVRVDDQLLAAVHLPASAQKKEPVDLILVADTSASMVIDNRLVFIQDALRSMVEHTCFLDLHEPVRFKNPMIRSVTLVSFNSVAKTVAAPFCTLGAYLDAVANLKPDGDTNFGRAFAEVYKHVRDQNGLPRIVMLFSDGKNDQEFAINDAFRRLNIVLYSIGIGRDNDTEFLMTIASEKGGQNAFVIKLWEFRAALNCVVTHSLRLGLFRASIASTGTFVNVRHMCFGTSFYALVKDTRDPVVLQFYDQFGDYCEMLPDVKVASEADVLKVEQLKVQKETVKAIAAALSAAKNSQFDAAQEILSDAGSALAEFTASHPMTQLKQVQTALDVAKHELMTPDTFARSALGGASYSAYQSLQSQSDFGMQEE